MAEYILGIDAGGTSVKSVLFDTNGKEIAVSVVSSEREKPCGFGFEEYDINTMWESTKTSIKHVINSSGVDSSKIKAIGVSSFGNGLVIVDKNGHPLSYGIFSQDHRASDIIDDYKASGNWSKINDITKGSLFAGEPGPLLRWYKENEPDIYSRIDKIMLCKDYIIYKLTGIIGADINNYGGSAMLNLNTLEYSKELMDLLGIPEMYKKLPKLMNCSDIIGSVTEHAAETTGLAKDTPVAIGMMDILACCIGSGGTKEGVATIIAGTWCINETLSFNLVKGKPGSDEFANHPGLVKGQFLNCSYTGASAINYEWFSRALGGTAIMEGEKVGISKFEILNKYIAQQDPSNTDVIYLPFVAQPSVHPMAKANFFNIHHTTEYGEIAYALAEGIVFMHKMHLDLLKGAGCKIEKGHLTGGIARSAEWAQLFADILQMPIDVVDCQEVGALGAAMTASVGAGIYKDYDSAVEQAVTIKESFQPRTKHLDAHIKRYDEWTTLIDVMMPYWESKK